MTRSRYGVILAVLVVAVAAAVASAQGPSGYKAPRTPWGDPDLQGIWPSTDMLTVPVERPASFGTRAILTDEEFARRQADAQRQAASDEEEVVAPRETSGAPGAGTGPPSHWGERGKAQRQASLIVEPGNGRKPRMTPDGEARMAMRARLSSTGDGPFDSPADLDYYDRCISRGVIGGILPVVYNNGTQIIQGPGYAVIRYEMIHEARVIPLDGRPGLPPSMRQYMGDARGRWEGDTLVVETKNFNGTIGVTGNGRLQPASDALTIVERFTRIDENTIQYEATVNDPKTWTAPWKVSFPLTRDDGYGFYEYACHEGNNAMRNILSGARAAERAAQGGAGR